MDKVYFDYKVGKATVEDVEDIMALTHEAFELYLKESKVSSPLSALTETYEDVKKDVEEKFVLIVRRNGLLMGSIRIAKLDEKTAYLSRFSVEKTVRNSGMGTTLMEIVDYLMKEQGITTLKLHTCSSYLPLVRFYYKMGFHIVSVENSRGYDRAELVKYLD